MIFLFSAFWGKEKYVFEMTFLGEMVLELNASYIFTLLVAEVGER